MPTSAAPLALGIIGAGIMGERLLGAIHGAADSPEEETEIRGLLGPVVEKVTFPAAEFTPGSFTTESDAIVAHFAARAGVEPAALPTYQSYLNGVFKNLGALYRENMDLKKRLPPA